MELLILCTHVMYMATIIHFAFSAHRVYILQMDLLQA